MYPLLGIVFRERRTKEAARFSDTPDSKFWDEIVEGEPDSSLDDYAV